MSSKKPKSDVVNLEYDWGPLNEHVKASAPLPNAPLIEKIFPSRTKSEFDTTHKLKRPEGFNSAYQSTIYFLYKRPLIPIGIYCFLGSLFSFAFCALTKKPARVQKLLGNSVVATKIFTLGTLGYYNYIDFQRRPAKT